LNNIPDTQPCPKAFSVPVMLRSAALGIIALVFGNCAIAAPGMPLGQKSFDAYRTDTLQWLRDHRDFQGSDPGAELTWNAPQEWRPTGEPRRGILLVHGLGDSPWSFHDIGGELAARGFLVRTVLLPGHGTQPADMLDVRMEDWRRVVDEQAAILRAEVGEIYLGGFSTGANLVLDYAYKHDDVAGLLLFSPAFQSSMTYDWLTPLISWARPWLLAPDASRPQQSLVRYMTVPTNGFAQFYRSSRVARQDLERRTYDKPVFIAVAAHDSVLDTNYVLQTFQQRFTHPDSRLAWYGTLPDSAWDMKRVKARTDYLPELRISQFSHMGLLFSPDNALYGEHGSLRFCWNGQTEQATRACEQGETVWYSDWGYREADKMHARLTFNPYFSWQIGLIDEVLGTHTVVRHASTAP